MLKHRLFISHVILIIISSTLLHGQQENPFEIKSRVGLVVPDSVNIAADTFSLDEEVSFVEKRQKVLIEANPFNVSHIPIRKQNLQEKPIENKDTSTVQKSEETSKKLLEKTGAGKTKFLFWFFLIQLLLVTSILGINREFIKKINRSISNDNFAKLVSRDYNGGYDALFAIMYILFILSLSIFVYLSVRHFSGISGFSKFVVFLFSVAGVYLFRHIFLGFLGFVFPFSKTLSYYNFMIILFNSYLGLLLIPINVTMAYSPAVIADVTVYIGFGLIAILYLLRFLRGSLHAYTFIRNHLFHFFLYLCTCEIAPILILVRFLSNSFSN